MMNQLNRYVEDPRNQTYLNSLPLLLREYQESYVKMMEIIPSYKEKESQYYPPPVCYRNQFLWRCGYLYCFEIMISEFLEEFELIDEGVRTFIQNNQEQYELYLLGTIKTLSEVYHNPTGIILLDNTELQKKIVTNFRAIDTHLAEFLCDQKNGFQLLLSIRTWIEDLMREMGYKKVYSLNLFQTNQHSDEVFLSLIPVVIQEKCYLPLDLMEAPAQYWWRHLEVRYGKAETG